MSFRTPTRTPLSIRPVGLVGVLAFVTFVAGGRGEDPPPGGDAAAKYQIDKDRRIFAGIKDDDRVQAESENYDEFLSYNEVFEFAHQFRAADLEAHARRDVSWKDLMSHTRDEFKLDLIYVEGKLWRVVRRDATPPLAAVGIPAVYEGWLFPKDATDPVCILFTDLPAGLTPAVELHPVPTVRFAGYAFKLIRYESHDKDPGNPGRGKIRRAPLLIGKSVTVIPTPVFSAGAEWQGTFVPGLLIGLGVLSAIGFGLAWWYRRGDRRVRSAIAGRAQQNPFASV